MSERDISLLAKIYRAVCFHSKRSADVATGTADTIDADLMVNLTSWFGPSTLKKARIYTFDCEAVLRRRWCRRRGFSSSRREIPSPPTNSTSYSQLRNSARFFFYYFSAFSVTSTAAQDNGVIPVRRWMLTDMPIAVPPRVQRHIVQFLDAETASIDNARAMVQKLTELADELKIATVNQLRFGELRRSD